MTHKGYVYREVVRKPQRTSSSYKNLMYHSEPHSILTAEFKGRWVKLHQTRLKGKMHTGYIQ